VNDDSVVDASDVRLVAQSVHSKPGSARWNEAADLNGDGVVDVSDLKIILLARKTDACGESRK